MRAKKHYQSFLLRVWREGVGDERRASLQNIASGEISYFANLTDMFAFLCVQVHGHPYPPGKVDEGSSQKQVQS